MFVGRKKKSLLSFIYLFKFLEMAYKEVLVFSELFQICGLYFPQELTNLGGMTRSPSSGSPEWGPALEYAPLLFCQLLDDSEFCVRKNFRPSLFVSEFNAYGKWNYSPPKRKEP